MNAVWEVAKRNTDASELECKIILLRSMGELIVRIFTLVNFIKPKLLYKKRFLKIFSDV